METKGIKIFKNVVDVYVRSFEGDHVKIQAIVYNHANLLDIYTTGKGECSQTFSIFLQFSIFCCYHVIKFCKLYSNFDNGGKLKNLIANK
jgi:hypothetical protein